MVDAHLGQWRGRLEAVALHKYGVGDEAEQVLRVADAAVTQVLESLEHGPRRDGGERRQLRVGLGLPAESQQRNPEPRATPPQLLQALGPRPPSAEQPHQHGPCPGELLIEERRGVFQRSRVGAPDVGEAFGQALRCFGGGQDLGVGGGDEKQLRCFEGIRHQASA